MFSLLTSDAKRFLVKFTFALVLIPVAVLLLTRDVLGPLLTENKNLIDGLAIVFAVISLQGVLAWSCFEAFLPESDEVKSEKVE